LLWDESKSFTPEPQLLLSKSISLPPVSPQGC
jgi:hypothetical protein